MKLLLIILSALYSSLVMEGQNMKSYYATIELAEQAIIERSYEVAIDYYITANEIHPLFLEDAHSGMKCATILKDSDAGIFFALVLEKGGVPKSFFTQNYKFNFLTNNLLWNEFYYSDYRQIDKQLVKILDSLLRRDQQFRSNVEPLHAEDSIMKVDMEIKIALLDIIAKKGFPTPSMFGVRMLSDTLINKGWNNFDVLWIHFTKNWPAESEAIMRNAMEKGIIRNSYYIHHSQNFIQDTNYEFYCFRTGSIIYLKLDKTILTCCCEKIAIINENRKKIFYNSIEKEKEKIRYDHINGTDFFSKRTGTLYPADEKSYPSVLDSFIKEGYILEKID